jgi:hypothetical protein
VTRRIKEEQPDDLSAQHRLAEAVQRACLEAARAGYEQAGWDGLCREGAWECALEAIRNLDVTLIVEKFGPIER